MQFSNVNPVDDSPARQGRTILLPIQLGEGTLSPWPETDKLPLSGNRNRLRDDGDEDDLVMTSCLFEITTRTLLLTES